MLDKLVCSDTEHPFTLSWVQGLIKCRLHCLRQSFFLLQSFHLTDLHSKAVCPFLTTFSFMVGAVFAASTDALGFLERLRFFILASTSLLFLYHHWHVLVVCSFSLDDQMSWNSFLLGLVMTNTKNSNCWRASSAGSADLDLRNENCGHWAYGSDQIHPSWESPRLDFHYKGLSLFDKSDDGRQTMALHY